MGLILLIMLLWQPPPITFIPLRYWTDERSKNPFDFFYSYVMLNRSCNIHIMKCRFSAASLSLIFLERRSYFFLLLDIFVHQFDSKIVFRVYDNSRFLKEVFLASILHHKASKFILQLWCSLIWCTIFLHVITKLMRIISPKLPRFILITYKYDFI